jgi:hypothetical protein
VSVDLALKMFLKKRGTFFIIFFERECKKLVNARYKGNCMECKKLVNERYKGNCISANTETAAV